MGFLPSSKLDGLVGGSYVIRNLNVAMIPLPFIEFRINALAASSCAHGIYAKSVCHHR